MRLHEVECEFQEVTQHADPDCMEEVRLREVSQDEC